MIAQRESQMKEKLLLFLSPAVHHSDMLFIHPTDTAEREHAVPVQGEQDVVVKQEDTGQICFARSYKQELNL